MRPYKRPDDCQLSSISVIVAGEQCQPDSIYLFNSSIHINNSNIKTYDSSPWCGLNGQHRVMPLTCGRNRHTDKNNGEAERTVNCECDVSISCSVFHSCYFTRDVNVHINNK